MCNNKHRWNKDKCRCEFKELIDKGMCGNGLNCDKESNCDCECEKFCDVGEYLDYKKWIRIKNKSRIKLVDKLVEEFNENTNGNEMIYNGTLNDYKKICRSQTIYIVLLVIFFIISINISSAFIYFH